ncbi:MAG: polysaccharide biosynthesis tyrosine autokinase, partial [Microbacterium sp.]
MTLRAYVTSLRRSWIVILVITLLGAGIGYGYAAVQTPQYEATAQVLITAARGESTSELVQGATYVQTLVESYALVAKTSTVLQPVIDELGLDLSSRELAEHVSVDNPLNTTLLDIVVVDDDPAFARKAANAIAESLATAVQSLSPQSDDQVPSVQIDTVAPADLPEQPFSPNTKLLTVAGLGIGLVIGVLIALLRTLLATRVTSASDIEEVTNVPILGSVVKASQPSLTRELLSSSAGVVAESVRGVAANIRFAGVGDSRRVILITSPSEGEGKSSVALAVAQILAEQNLRVLIIDADLRRASLAHYTQLEGAVGLTTVLLGDVTQEDAAQTWADGGLQVLTSGVLPPNPTQLLSSERMADVLKQVREDYDVILIDTAPVNLVSDALLLANVSDGFVVVARIGKTKREALRRAISALEATRTPVLGIISNGERRAQLSNPYYRPATPLLLG